MTWISGPCVPNGHTTTRAAMVVAGVGHLGDEVVIALTVLPPDSLAPVTVVLPPEQARQVRDALDHALARVEAGDDEA